MMKKLFLYTVLSFSFYLPVGSVLSLKVVASNIIF